MNTDNFCPEQRAVRATRERHGTLRLLCSDYIKGFRRNYESKIPKINVYIENYLIV